jgi:hypothetical protein
MLLLAKLLVDFLVQDGRGRIGARSCHRALPSTPSVLGVQTPAVPNGTDFCNGLLSLDAAKDTHPEGQ